MAAVMCIMYCVVYMYRVDIRFSFIFEKISDVCQIRSQAHAQETGMVTWTGLTPGPVSCYSHLTFVRQSQTTTLVSDYCQKLANLGAT